MKTTKRIAALLALLLTLTAFGACTDNGDKDKDNSALDQVQNGQQTDTADKETTPPVSDSEELTTEEDTTEPVTEEPTEEVTEPLPSHGSLKLPCDGTLTSKESKYLYLSAYYAVSENADGTLSVTVDVTLTGYEMYVGARFSGCTLTVGGQSISFTTDAIRCTDPNKMSVIPLVAETFTLPADTTEIPITVTWPFNGNYGNVDLKDLVISEVIK